MTAELEPEERAVAGETGWDTAAKGFYNLRSYFSNSTRRLLGCGIFLWV